jgi:hypothetical protein
MPSFPRHEAATMHILKRRNPQMGRDTVGYNEKLIIGF